jgi:hypothetical protein
MTKSTLLQPFKQIKGNIRFQEEGSDKDLETFQYNSRNNYKSLLH